MGGIRIKPGSYNGKTIKKFNACYDCGKPSIGKRCRKCSNKNRKGKKLGKRIIKVYYKRASN
jgi:hypothetical protein